MSKETLKQLVIAVSSTFIMVIIIAVVKVSGSSIDELESEKKQNESNKESVESQLSDLSESQEDLQKYVDSLGTQLAAINEEIEEIELKITEKESEIVLNQELLEDSKEDEKYQFDDMKIRIQFMYEMGEEFSYEFLLTGGNISDGLNRAEYISSLIKYDRRMLDKYRRTIDLIADTEDKLRDDREKLQTLKQELVVKKKKISDKMASSKDQIKKLSKEIDGAQASKAEYEMIILEKNNEIIRRREEESIRESIQESIRESEEAASREEETTEETEETEPYMPIDEASEIDLLATIIYCEAGDQTKEGMYAVGSVVINRIKSPNFPNTMLEVLEQPYQFSPVSVSGRFYMALERGEASKACRDVATDILTNGVITGKWLFFRMNDGSVDGEIIDDQVFY